LRGSQSLSGEKVDESTALNYSAFWNGVNLYSGTISTLPLHLKRKTAKRKVLASEHPLFRVLYAQANPFMTAQVLRAVLMAHILTWGNGYAEIVRNGYGNVIQLWPITPHRVKPKWENNEIIYEITVDGEVKTLRSDKILHLHGLGYDGLVGYSIVKMAMKSIGLGMAMETFGSLYFSNGTHPGIIVSHPGHLTQEGHQNLKTALTETYSSLGNSHRLMLLQEAMKIEKMTIAPEESQFLESRQFQITEMAQWFNLPPHKLKDLSRSSFNNIESEQISFVTDSILPWLVTLEQQYDTQLLTLDEQIKQNLFFKHNVEGLLRGSAETRARLYQAMFQVGGISPNDIREKEDMDPIDDPMADEYFVPMNMVPLSLVREQLNKKNTPQPGNNDFTGEKGEKTEERS